VVPASKNSRRFFVLMFKKENRVFQKLKDSIATGASDMLGYFLNYHIDVVEHDVPKTEALTKRS
jgi:hypothetical protein